MRAYYRGGLSGLDQRYHWAIPTPPPGCRLEGGSLLARNLQLRRWLAARWPIADSDERLRLVRFYVCTWGGIKRNAETTLRWYAEKSAADILQLGLRGIASWSKVLTMREPERFAIYDARVAASLNALQLLHGSGLVVAFPRIPGRNTKIDPFWRAMRGTSAWLNAVRMNTLQVYPAYLDLLKTLQKEVGGRGKDWHMLEMALFADAEHLAERAGARLR